jgi:hypothetical protein
MAEVPSSIAISPSGATLLNAMQVTTSAGSVLNEVVTLGDYASGQVATVLAEGAILVEPGGTNTQPVSGTFFPPVQTVTGTVGVIQATAGNLNATVAGTVTANAGSGTLTVTGAVTTTFPAVQTVTGTVNVIDPAAGSLGAAVPSQGFYNGLIAATAYPAAATGGNLVGQMADKAGRACVVLNTVRNLVGVYTNASFTATSALGIVTAAAATFCDLTALIITNPMTTAASVTLSDGSNSYLFNLAPNGGIAENLTTPLPMSTAAATWVANLSSAGTVSFIMLYANNK